MFKCKVCQEKNARIAELKDEIEYLRSLVFPNNDPYKITFNEREADALLTADVPVREESEDELKQAANELAERDKILTGNY